MLSVKIQYTSDNYAWTGFTDFGLAKTLLVVKGERFVCGIPMSRTTGDIYDRSKQLVTMSTQDLQAAGGFWTLLQAGDGLRIPPAYVIAECGVGRIGSLADGSGSDSLHFVTLADSEAENDLSATSFDEALMACRNPRVAIFRHAAV